MGLRAHLILRLLLVTLLVMVGAIVWSVADTYRTARLEVRATFARASMMIERRYRLGLEDFDSARFSRASIEILTVMAPGTCVEYEVNDEPLKRLCAGWQVFGRIPPAWFREALYRALGPLETLEKSAVGPEAIDYFIETSFDPVAAATRAWQQVKLALAQAFAMALGIMVLGLGVILHSLQPVRQIVTGLGRLAEGDLATRLQPAGPTEFRRIGRAVNDLARALRQGAAERTALTRKLLEVEDAERRQLARDLHDEFGQTLTATSALAASIEVASLGSNTEISADARAIGRNIRQMMDTLRGAFARLRPPDLDEVGLEASLRSMIAGWSASRRGRTRFLFLCRDDLSAIPPHTALNIYRIVQECVTNAVRHGTPSVVRIELGDKTRDGTRLHVLTVEDDGGGSVDEAGATAGHGILGIRERVIAMGGAFSVGDAGGGVRVEVTVPALQQEPDS